jgi:hypothetical protein
MKMSHILEGYDSLDVFLAKQRYKTAERKMRLAKKDGRILNIGCGCYPLFLTTVDFAEKYGLDKNIEAGRYLCYDHTCILDGRPAQISGEAAFD